MVTARTTLLGAMALLVSGCGPEAPPPEGRDASAEAPSDPVPDDVAVGSRFAPSPTEEARKPVAATLLGEKVARAEWTKATNRRSCAPLALKSDAKAGGIPRAASYSGGWAVAFDQLDRRSAYGFAGVGALPDDKLDFTVLVDRLAKQWPYLRRWNTGDNLPAGSAAGYGLEGARDYTSGSSGFGQQSVAYLRIPGQACMYNIWSRLGRDHLELLLSEMVVLKP